MAASPFVQLLKFKAKHLHFKNKNLFVISGNFRNLKISHKHKVRSESM